MIQKKLLVAVTAVVLMWASEAQATAILTIGNTPQQGDENILLNTGETGNPIFGETNQTHLAFGSQARKTSRLLHRVRRESRPLTGFSHS